MRHYVTFGGQRHEINPHWRANLAGLERIEHKKVMAQMHDMIGHAAAEFVPGQINHPGLSEFHKRFPKLAVHDLRWRVEQADRRARVGDAEFVAILEDIERTHGSRPQWAEMNMPVARRFYFDGIFIDPEGKAPVRKGVKTSE
jgi:hypothetical protein